MGAIRTRLGERPAPPERPPAGGGEGGDLELFVSRLEAARGTCTRTQPGGVAVCVKRHIESLGAGSSVAIADDLGRRYDWAEAGIDATNSRPPAECDVGVTRATCAIADTGSLVVTSSGAGEIELSLLPAHHVCILDETQIVGGLDEAFAKTLEGDDRPRNVTLITGPSVTADIEQSLVKGAHGPLSLHVVIEERPREGARS